MAETIRFSADAMICLVYDDIAETFRVASQDDMDTLPVGADLTPEELEEGTRG